MKTGADTATAEALREALERMHARDREQVAAGERRASSLHLIPAADARRAKVRWTAETTAHFKG